VSLALGFHRHSHGIGSISRDVLGVSVCSSRSPEPAYSGETDVWGSAGVLTGINYLMRGIMCRIHLAWQHPIRPRRPPVGAKEREGERRDGEQEGREAEKLTMDSELCDRNGGHFV
jgi:hypothetical protein